MSAPGSAMVPQHGSTDTLLSSKQLAGLTGVSTVTLSRWRSEGRGPPFLRLSASRVAYPLAAYREWVCQSLEEASHE